MNCSLLAPRRRSVQYLLVTLYLALPFLALRGVPLLRIDLTGNTLFLAAQPIRIDEFYLVLMLTLLGTVLFLLITALLGRVWCGWLCPQTVLNDLVELLPELLKARKPSQRMLAAIRQGVSVLLALVMSLATLAYFLPYTALLRNLSQPTDHPVLFGMFLFLAASIYLNVALVRRSFCKSYCPYGRLQTAFMSASTLNLAFREEVRDRCIRCNSCVRVCPMGVDIREGFQIECINCGRCLDACRLVMARKDGSDGLIAYRFGVTAGGRPQLTGALIFLSLASLALATALLYSLTTRTGAGFAVQRNQQAAVRTLPDGSRLVAWSGVIENRTQVPAFYRLELGSSRTAGISLQGQTRDLNVAPNSNRTISFFLRLAEPGSGAAPVELLLFRQGNDAPVATVRLQP